VPPSPARPEAPSGGRKAGRRALAALLTPPILLVSPSVRRGRQPSTLRWLQAVICLRRLLVRGDEEARQQRDSRTAKIREFQLEARRDVPSLLTDIFRGRRAFSSMISVRTPPPFRCSGRRSDRPGACPGWARRSRLTKANRGAATREYERFRGLPYNGLGHRRYPRPCRPSVTAP